MTYIKRKPKISEDGTKQWPTYAPLKRSSIKKKPTKTKEAFGFKNQLELFNYLWLNSDKKCFISGKDLTTVPTDKWHFMFSHVLNKGKYTKWKLNPANIVVIHPDIHYLYDFGTIEQQDNSGYDFEPLRKLKEQLKIEYEHTYH